MLSNVRAGKCSATNHKAGCLWSVRSQKPRKVEYCLAEGIRASHREFMSTASSMAIASDEREGRLLVRFRAVNDRLQTRCGVLGWERNFGKGNLALTRALTVIFERFATVGACRPNRDKDEPTASGRARDAIELATSTATTALSMHDSGSEGVFMKPLFDHICSITEFFVADAAGDEQLCGKNMQKGFLSNLRIVHYDQAHGSRRLTQRPWEAQPATKHIVETLITGRSSITALLQNSGEFQQWLGANMVRTKTAESVMVSALNCGLKRHRFDSTQVPLARHVLRLPAIIRTAVQIAEARNGTESVAAKSFLQFSSGPDGMFNNLLLAMLADAGDESIILLRQCDTEDMSPSDIPFDVAQYAQRIQTLFFDDAVLTTGYTKLMLETLSRPMVYVVNGIPLQCGSTAGVPASTKNAALKEMRCWTRLALETLRAEFPDFSILNDMSIFKLGSVDEMIKRQKSNSVISAGGADITQKAHRLARFFHQDPGHFISQYTDVFQIAASVYAQRRCGQQEAWCIAVDKCRTCSTNLHPTDAL
eukprot:6490884-Amphidinium_carterae.1